MSLINDALKRANEAAPPPPPSVPGEAMQVAPESRHPKLPLILIPVLLLFVVGLAVWFFAKGLEVARQVYRSSATTLHARESLIPEPEKADTNATANASIAESAPAATASPTPVPAQINTNMFPELKLQALFYRKETPTAVINNKPVGIGSRINGATVLSITREGVQVVWHGEARELVLP